MSFLNLFFSWKTSISSVEEMKKAQVVITHEFGDQKEVNDTTMDIVYVGIKIAKQLNIPMICQSPGDMVAYCQQLEPVLIIDRNLQSEGSYLDTNEVNRQVSEICQKNGWTYVVVCAHPHHAWRVGKNLEKFGLIPIFPDLLGIKYCSIPSRLTLSSPWYFIPREICARILYYFKGYI